MYSFFSVSVLLIHLFFVLFVTGGFIYTAAGYFLKLKHSANMKFRIIHLCAVVFITVQAWIGRICPLTDLENLFRTKAGEIRYEESFMEHWIEKIIYYDLPFVYFTAAYSVFLCLVLVFLFIYPPVKKRKDS